MKKVENLTREDEQLLAQARGWTSRHQQISPTPRDTMAVLRQAAEQPYRQPGAWAFPWASFSRWAAGLAAAALIAVLIWPRVREMTPDLVPSAIHATAPAPDLGLDLADWDLEFDALMNEFTETLNQGVVTESDVGGEFNLNNQEWPRL